MSEQYFSSLNYSLANEDASVETGVLPYGSSQVLSIAGSGGRVVPLASKQPKKIICVDVCKVQLHLTEMRFSALRNLNFDEYLKLLGYQESSPKLRKQIFSKLDFTPEAKDRMTQVFNSCNWGDIIYLGRWEQFIGTLHAAIVKVIGKKSIAELFACTSLEEQRHFMKTRFPKRRWSGVVFLLGNSIIFNSILYKGSFPKKNINESFFSFYRSVFDKLFHNCLARDNFYLNLMLLGKLEYERARPIEAQEDIFLKAQKGAQGCTIEYQLGSIIEVASKCQQPTSFVSMSNVPSYLIPPMEQSFVQLMRPYLEDDAIITNRYYMRIPENLDISGFAKITDDYQELVNHEQMGMYFFDILKHKRG